jgi:hypothetical protein
MQSIVLLPALCCIHGTKKQKGKLVALRFGAKNWFKRSKSSSLARPSTKSSPIEAHHARQLSHT